MAAGDDDRPSAAVIQEELHKEGGENCTLLFIMGQTLVDLEAIFQGKCQKWPIYKHTTTTASIA